MAGRPGSKWHQGEIFKKKQEKRKRRRCMQDHPLPWVHQCTGTGGSTGQHRSITGRSIGFRVGRSGPPRERRKASADSWRWRWCWCRAPLQAVPCDADALSGVRSLLCPVRGAAAATRMPQLPSPGAAQHSALGGLKRETCERLSILYTRFPF